MIKAWSLTVDGYPGVIQITAAPTRSKAVAMLWFAMHDVDIPIRWVNIHCRRASQFDHLATELKVLGSYDNGHTTGCLVPKEVKPL